MDLLSPLPRPDLDIAPGVKLLPRFADSAAIMRSIEEIASTSPFRSFFTPGGRKMSVEMTNCGERGWISDAAGYRYVEQDPATGRSWPAIPESFERLAIAAAGVAGFVDFRPDVCLINSYAPGTRLSLHQDRDEADFSHPIVSVSIGLPCTFLWGGQRRIDPTQRIRLENGDVLVFGGKARMNFHGVEAIEEGRHPLTGRRRVNLTFRRAG